MNRIRIAIALTAVLSIIAGYAFKGVSSVDESLYLQYVAPDNTFEKTSLKPSIYTAKDGTIAFNTYHFAPEISGYAGPIKTLVALSAQGRITGIKILDNKETQNYVHSMDKPEFLSQFIGKGISDPLKLDRDIDGISRATVSVSALTDSIRIASRRAGQSALGISVVEGVSSGSKMNYKAISYLLLFAIAYAVYRHSKRRGTSWEIQRMRDAILASSIMVIGIWASSPFSIIHLLNALMLRVPSDVLMLIALLAVLVSMITDGRFYCGWLCPFGAITEFMDRLNKRKWLIGPVEDMAYRKLKYLLLGIVIAAVLITGKTHLGNFEVYLTLFSVHGTFLGWTVLALSLLSSIRVRRLWCRVACPVAALSGIMAREVRSYTSISTCPMSNPHAPPQSECIRCNRCLTKL